MVSENADLKNEDSGETVILFIAVDSFKTFLVSNPAESLDALYDLDSGNNPGNVS